MKIFIFLLFRVAILLSVSTVLVSCVGPSGLIRVHAYDGPESSAEEIATVFAVWGGFGGERTVICSVDNVNYRKIGAMSNCPSVVYVKPGKHKIGLQYYYANYSGGIEIDILVATGRTYKIESHSTDGLKTATYEIVEMPFDFELRYKDIIPVPLKEKFREEGEQLVLPSDTNY